MPLSAIYQGGNVVGMLMPDEDWQRLLTQREKGALVTKCCRSLAFPRVSKLGTRHFVHQRKGECASGPESAEHMRAKEIIVRATRAAGWEAEPEVAGDGWVADVLATLGKARIAFEVQWSPQTLQETEARQRRYDEADVRGCWFFKRPPHELKAQRVLNESALIAQKELPLFSLHQEGDDFSVGGWAADKWKREDPPTRHPLAEVITALLTRRIRHVQALTPHPQQHVTVVFPEINCWRCKRPHHVYEVLGDFRSCCGVPLSGEREGYETRCDPAIVGALAAYLRTHQGQTIKIGDIKQRFSKTERRSYLSQGCPWCDALCGEFFLERELRDLLGPHADPTKDYQSAVLTVAAQPTVKAHFSHWCFPQDATFCSSQATGEAG